MGDWYYIGHYGQLGPLTREQIDELIGGGVISRETYVWRAGMSQWQAADAISDLSSAFRAAEPYIAPPPPPPMMTAPPPRQANFNAYGMDSGTSYLATQQRTNLATVPSDRSRVLGGILQIIFPGIGRMYLGYLAYGLLQLVFTFCTFGVGWLWSFIDGLIILSGSLKMDGYGRNFND